MAFNIGPIDKECPCERACPERNPECHGKCERYNQWRRKKDEELALKNKRHVSSDTMSDAKKRAIWKKMRTSRKVHYNKGRDL